ncbi:MAG: 23S rRNA (adenine(2503)-C(2))-methyltransferase RlmN [Myxococcaceae bacterium]|nr:23S rRNA (adenine(2503)-C(2))-methyltransferase RlmN [Myxococcaceae bacterium]MCI0673318.1 23S rRNA (adenine(2503)-C(2))-methyltransferase RlmN [Myxococcaceae bacterium]
MPAPSTPNLYDLDRGRLDVLLGQWGLSPLYRERVWTALHRQRVTSTDAVEGLRPEHYGLLRERAHVGVLPVHTETASAAGDARKLLLSLRDGQTIETVLMRFSGRTTVCVSTQAGCAMGCVFCATGQMGFVRHLTPGEIVAQVLHVCRLLDAEGERLRNVVLMGMGEPLHNYDAVMEALDILQEPTGVALGPRYVTLSTVGVVPGIRRLAAEDRPLRLAVSLHAATDAERAALVPAARKWPLAELMDACREYSARRRERIFFEWALIAGKNDGPEQAHAVGRLLEGMDAHLNLIPLNPTGGYAETPSGATAVRAFQDVLASYRVPSTVRQRRGIDIDAGCGQLRAKVESARLRPRPSAAGQA